VKPKQSFGVVTEKQPLHIVAEVKSVKVLRAHRCCDHGVIGAEHNLLFVILASSVPSRTVSRFVFSETSYSGGAVVAGELLTSQRITIPSEEEGHE
jgi:hypothetical protein